MPNTHGKKKNGTPITDDMVEAMADEAEAGYDVIGSGPSSVESVRLDPELKRDLLLRASEEGVSVSELIRKALRQYVKAN